MGPFVSNSLENFLEEISKFCQDSDNFQRPTHDTILLGLCLGAGSTWHPRSLLLIISFDPIHPFYWLGDVGTGDVASRLPGLSPDPGMAELVGGGAELAMRRTLSSCSPIIVGMTVTTVDTRKDSRGPLGWGQTNQTTISTHEDQCEMSSNNFGITRWQRIQMRI